MELDDSLPNSQAPATCPCPEPDQYSSCHHPNPLRPTLILSSHLSLSLPHCVCPWHMYNLGVTSSRTKHLLLPLNLKDCLHKGKERLQQGGWRISTRLVTIQGAHRAVICTQLSKFRTFIISITKLCRQPAEVRKNHNTNVRTDEKANAQHKKRNRLNLGRRRSYVPTSAPVADLPSSRSKVRNNKQDKQTPKKIRTETFVRLGHDATSLINRHPPFRVHTDVSKRR